MQLEACLNKNEFISRAFAELEEERRITKKNIGEDIYKMSEALSNLKDLSVEGNLIREDLLGLLDFEGNSIHEVDSLMIERHKDEERSRRFCRSQKTIIQ